MSINCRSCGQELPDNSRFCAKCGQPVIVEETAPVAESAPMETSPVAAARKPLPLKIIIPMATIALAVLIAAGIGWFFYQNPKAPDLASMDVEQATAEINASGLALGEVAYDAASEEATWTVIAQSTAAGTRVKRGTRMDLTLAGAPPTDVPAVVGLPRAQAESEITSATLVVGPVTELYDSVVPAGAVVSQEPTAGVSVPEGTSVSLLLSKGPQPIPVPNVVGAAEADAAAALQAAGFTAAPTPQDNAAPKGTIISQTPVAGTLVPPGTAVTIAVSTGVEMVKVPDFRNYAPRGDDYEEAVDWMWAFEDNIVAGFRRAGLKADIEWYPWTDDEKPYQSPKAGSMVPKGTTVKIVLYSIN